jgi:phosphinothricin acetyltransferase
MALRIEQARKRHAWLVLEIDGRVAGYAYGHPFAERAAYRWSCEVSIYLERERHRSGGGLLLGFEQVGVYHRVGWKNGAWHDVAWVQKTLLDAHDPPAEPR